MKVLKRIVDGLIRQEVSIDDQQFSFVPGRGTTDPISVVRQLQEKKLAVSKWFYMAFVDLVKAFHCVPPGRLSGGCFRKPGVEEWTLCLVRECTPMPEACPCWRLFEVKVGVPYSYIFIPLLFIIMLEALLCQFQSRPGGYKTFSMLNSAEHECWHFKIY